MTNTRTKWTDYERVQVIRHHRTFGRANLDILVASISNHSYDSVKLELDRFDIWLRTGIMEFGKNKKPGRKGVVESYTRIIQTLGI